jgi:hypothetical protein
MRQLVTRACPLNHRFQPVLFPPPALHSDVVFSHADGAALGGGRGRDKQTKTGFVG